MPRDRDSHHFDDFSHAERNARELFESLLPLDPFLGEDSELSAEFGDEEPPEPLGAEERAQVVTDLRDLLEFQRVLEPRGVRGLCMDCDGCEETHYYAWEILRSNLINVLRSGQSHVHEPPFNPDPTEFVSWDYASGYVDAVHDAEADQG